MLTLQALTLKNFLSIGAVTQTVNLDNRGLVLVLGENLDLGGNDNKNGTGKCLRGDTLVDIHIKDETTRNKFLKFLSKNASQHR